MKGSHLQASYPIIQLPWRMPVVLADFRGRRVCICSAAGVKRMLSFSETGRFLGKEVVED